MLDFYRTHFHPQVIGDDCYPRDGCLTVAVLHVIFLLKSNTRMTKSGRFSGERNKLGCLTIEKFSGKK